MSIIVEHKTDEQRKMIVLKDFIDQMDLAYRAADLVVSRAGASSISELSLLEKACILIPSPNVAEDHQTKNAKALASKKAAILLPDRDAKDNLAKLCLDTIWNPKLLQELSTNIKSFARPKATQDIVNVIEQIKKS